MCVKLVLWGEPPKSAPKVDLKSRWVFGPDEIGSRSWDFKDFKIELVELDIILAMHPLQILIEQSEIKSSDPGLWYLLAETQGLAGNIIGLHESRAEFFILNGNLDQAEKQLNYALELSRTNYQKTEILHQRLKDIKDIRSRLDY